MPALLGSLVALVALLGGISARLDPFTCLSRAFLAWVVGWFLGSVWWMMFNVKAPLSPANPSQIDVEEPPVTDTSDELKVK